MKKITLLFLVIIFISCSKSEEIGDGKVSTTQITDFTIVKDPNRTLDNIMVNETLKFSLLIENFDLNPNVTYVLKPISVEAKKHQIINVDYNFQQKKLTIPTDPNVSSYENMDSIKINAKNSNFFIKVLKPGNFQHVYTIRKMVGNKYTEPVISKDVLFSAVKIYLKYVQNTRGCGFLGWSTCYDRTYMMKIDDGDEQFDDYLTNGPAKSHSFETIHDGEQYFGSTITSSNNEVEFSKKHESINPNSPPHSLNILNELKITQTFINGNFNNIRYRNIQY